MASQAVSSHTESGLTQNEIRLRILHILGIYPIISPTMLQGGLGPFCRPADWRPILSELLEEGVVIREEEQLPTTQGRSNSYSKLRLTTTDSNIRKD